MTPLEFLGRFYVYGTVFIIVLLAVWAITFLSIPPWFVVLVMVVFGLYLKYKDKPRRK
jgi:hypothetical protein